MGLLGFLKKTNAVWNEVPEDAQPMFRGFIDSGIAADEAMVPMDPLVELLRGRVVDPELVTRLMRAVFEKNAKTHRLAAVDIDGVTRFFTPEAAQAVASVLSALLAVDLETTFALVRHDAAALEEMSDALGAEGSDAMTPMDPQKCLSVSDLIIADALSVLSAQPLSLNEGAADVLCDSLDVDTVRDAGSYFGLLPEGQTLAATAHGAMVLLGLDEALSLRARLQAEGHAAQEFVPVALASPLTVAVDITGRSGEKGAVYACTREFMTLLAPSLTQLFGAWEQSSAHLLHLARTVPN